MSVTHKFRINFIIYLAYFSAVLTFIKVIFAIGFYFKYNFFDLFWISRTKNSLLDNKKEI